MTPAERDAESIKRAHKRCSELPYSTWNRTTDAEQLIWREERIGAIEAAVAEERARYVTALFKCRLRLANNNIPEPPELSEALGS